MNNRHLRRALGAALLACACLAQAAPSPKDVDAVMRSRDWPRAESLLKDVISAKPESAKPRYYLAQVYEQQGRMADAARELQRAEKLDPSLAFSKDPSKYYAMKSRLAKATTVAPAPVAMAPRAAAPAPVRERTIAAPAATTYTAAVQPAAPRATVAQSSDGGSFGKVLLWLAVIAAIGGGIFYFVSRRSKQQAQVQGDADRRDALKRMLAVQAAADKAVLDLDLAGKEASPVCTELRRINREFLDDISALQRTNRAAAGTGNVQPSARERRIAQLTQLAVEGKTEFPAPAPAPTATSPAAQGSLHAEADAFSSRSTPRSSSPMAPTSGYNDYHSHHSAPSTVIVERERDSSLFETIALAQVLSHAQEPRERVIERTVVREVPAPAPRYREDPAPELDLDSSPYRAAAPAPAAELDLDDADDKGGSWDTPAAEESSAEAPAAASSDDKWD